MGVQVKGRMFVEGKFVDIVTGIPESRAQMVMLRPPDDATRLEVSSFLNPVHVPGSVRSAPGPRGGAPREPDTRR